MEIRKLIVAAAASAFASGATAQTVACNTELNVTDQDPTGLNVRASPGGAVIRTLKAHNRWVQVEVTGANGPWARIKSATLEADENDVSDGSVMWKGVGWVAFSKLGFSYFNGHTRIRAAPGERARVLLEFTADDSSGPYADAILGCDHYWLKVRVKGVVGWTDTVCTEELTTCTSPAQ